MSINQSVLDPDAISAPTLARTGTLNSAATVALASAP